jgi:hypothetical protein
MGEILARAAGQDGESARPEGPLYAPGARGGKGRAARGQAPVASMAASVASSASRIDAWRLR